MLHRKESVVPAIQFKKGQPVDRLQKQFNQRIQKIHQLKKEIEAIEKAIPEIRSLIQKELQPVQDQIVEGRVRLVKQFDKAYYLKFFRHREKEKLQDIILNHAYDLIRQYSRHDLEEIYDKHAETSYQEEEQLTHEANKEMAEGMFKSFFDIDLDLEDVDMNVFGQISQKFLDSIQEKAQQEEEKQKQRKKTKAQLAREKKMKEEAENISKTSRAIYTRLVKEFHPDKEAGEEKKLWKTETMKRVTQAYKSDDFYTLLSLEIELMQGNAHDVGELPDDQLKHYNKILKDQIDELQMQLVSLRSPLPPFDTLSHLYDSPQQAPRLIRQERRMLEEELATLENDILYFSDKKNIREFLRDYNLEEDDDEDLYFFDFP